VYRVETGVLSAVEASCGGNAVAEMGAGGAMIFCRRRFSCVLRVELICDLIFDPSFVCNELRKKQVAEVVRSKKWDIAFGASRKRGWKELIEI
jgi:hypothetical protein